MSAKRRDVSRGLVKRSWLLTCEHAGNRVPSKYKELFEAYRELLDSHRGWDPGAWPLAQRLQQALRCPLFATQTTRLLIETNRSLHHPYLFSTVTRSLSAEIQEELIRNYYLPHRLRVENQIQKLVDDSMVVFHIGVHSFTPSLDGEVRNADIGLLYDPQRSLEREFCQIWKRELLKLEPNLKIRMNYPYRGSSDGLTTSLRKLFSNRCYAGIELEVNQKYPLRGGKEWKRCVAVVQGSLKHLERLWSSNEA